MQLTIKEYNLKTKTYQRSCRIRIKNLPEYLNLRHTKKIKKIIDLENMCEAHIFFKKETVAQYKITRLYNYCATVERIWRRS